MKLFPNKFDGRCSNHACPNKRNVYNGVKRGEGFTVYEDGRYTTWCKTCCPHQYIAPPPPVRKLTAEGKVITPYEPDNLPLFRSFPGARWDGDQKCWRVSLADADRPRVLELADRLGLDVDPALRAVRETAQKQTAALDPRLYKFQVDGVHFLSLGNRRLLGDDMGLGKSVQALIALPKDTGALVVCPNVVKYNWKNEAAKWRPDLKVEVLANKGAFRAPRPGELLVTNYEGLPDYFMGTKDEPAPIPEELKTALTTCYLISDEIHFCKNYRAQRSKKVNTLARLCKAVWGLTGTPLLNRPPDLWGVLDSLDMAKLAFDSFSKFMRLFNAYKGRWGGIEWGAPNPEVPEMLRRVMLRRTRTEALPDLPNKTYTTVVVNDLPAKLKLMLDAAYDEWADVLEAGDLPPFEEFSGLRALLAAARTDAALEYAEDCEEQSVPLVVFSAHRKPIDVLAEREGWATITGDTKPEERQNIVNRFQAGELKGVGLTIQAGGVGLTLTRAWKALFVDLDWTPANNAQAEDRICRIGQASDKVEIVRMVSNHPLDQHVLQLIDRKIAMIYGAVEKLVMARVPEPAPQQTGESDADYADRMTTVAEARAAYDAALAQAKADADARDRQETEVKVKALADRMISKVGQFLAAPITPERATDVRAAFATMCDADPDYAEFQNGVGFNKPDSYFARLLGQNLGTDDEVRAMHGLLWKYRRQLESRYPRLWDVG